MRVGYIRQKQTDMFQSLVQNPKNYLHVCSSLIDKKTKIRNRGLVARDDLTGTNWSKIPVSLIEMGFLSNPSEDRKMQKSNFQTKMAKGIADGIDAYFK